MDDSFERLYLFSGMATSSCAMLRDALNPITGTWYDMYNRLGTGGKVTTDWLNSRDWRETSKSVLASFSALGKLWPRRL